MSETNPNPRRSIAKITKPPKLSVTHYVEQLAGALGISITAQRIAMYVKALSDLSEPQIAYAFDFALKNFKPEYGRNFPYPAQLLGWGYHYEPPISEDRLLLDRGDKPPGWEPVSIEELRREIAAANDKNRFPKGDR